jgi:lysophospholipase L1-like esterase
MRFHRCIPLILALTSGVCAAGDAVRIACIGDSITFGACVEDRENNSYPKVLENILRADLGPGYQVKNFGVNGATMVKDGCPAYIQSPEYPAALAFNPNAVVIMLGTNDSKPGNWASKGHFASDLAAMVTAFAKLPAKPLIWVMLPPPTYAEGWGIRTDVIANEVVPMVREEATKEKLPIIDLFAFMTNHKDWFAEGIHPNVHGAKEIAQYVAKSLEPKLAKVEAK